MIKNRLFELLLLYNIKPTDIANITQFDRTTITRVLKGEAQLIPFELINKLKDTLNVSLDFIFNDVPNNAIKLKCNKLESDTYINYYQYLLLKFHNLIYDELKDNKVINHILPDNLSYIFDTRSKINKNIQKEIENSNILDYMSFMLIPTTNLTYYKNKVLNIYKALFIDSLFYVYGDDYYNKYFTENRKNTNLFNFKTKKYDIVFEEMKIAKEIYKELVDKKGNCNLSKFLFTNRENFEHIIDCWGIYGYLNIELDKEYPHITLTVKCDKEPTEIFNEMSSKSNLIEYGSTIGVYYSETEIYDPKIYNYGITYYSFGKMSNSIPADILTAEELMEQLYEEINNYLTVEDIEAMGFRPNAFNEGEEFWDNELGIEKKVEYDASKLWKNEPKNTLEKSKGSTEWGNLIFKKEDVISKDDKSILFKLSSSISEQKYIGYKFYHRSNMCKEVGENIIITFTVDWNFVVFKDEDDGKVIDKQQIKASEFYKIIMGQDFVSNS